MSPTLGRIVLYTLSEADADAINRRRTDFMVTCNQQGGSPTTGYVAHVGNSAALGQQYPAVVVACFGGDRANLHVLMDGNDTYWATSRGEGEGPGTWMWPPRA